MPGRTKHAQGPSLPISVWLEHPGERIDLPAVGTVKDKPLDQCLRERRSIREYSEQPLTFQEVVRLLWAAQGVTGVGSLRAAPSAGAIYPLKLNLAAMRVEGLPPGLFCYDADGHTLEMIAEGDYRDRLVHAAMGQSCMASAAIAVLVTCWEKRLRAEYGDQAPILAAIEAGHLGQNFLLEAVSLGLGAIGLSYFDPDLLRATWPFRADEYPLYLLLAGRV